MGIGRHKPPGVFFLLAWIALPLGAQGPPPPLADPLLDHLVGRWELTGEMGGKPLHQSVTASWVLGHRYLQLHYEDVTRPPGIEFDYEAIAFVGYDVGERTYLMHLIDVFGAGWSRTLGIGTRTGNSIRFAFDYPVGTFYTTMEWMPEKRQWVFLLEQEGPAGRTPFARKVLRPLTDAATR